MVRPKFMRNIASKPIATVFKPAGIPANQLKVLVLTLDEYEAIRLADLEGRYHLECAQLMGISRPTFGRILEDARKKIAEALVYGKALHIEGGNVQMEDLQTWFCGSCSLHWRERQQPAACPRCESPDLHPGMSPGGLRRRRGRNI